MIRFRAVWRIVPLALCLAVTSSWSAITDQRIDALAQQVKPRVIEWRRDIHQHPELSNREFRTAKKVETHLRGLGLAVTAGIAHTGVVGVLRGGKPGPMIALRADMDALPVTEQVDVPFKSKATAEFGNETVGVMHACGHDAHTAILMAVAEVLSEVRDDLPGSVLFIFQPAEEGAPPGEEGGARLVLKEGLFDKYKPEVIFALHVHTTVSAGDVGYRAGPFMAASDRFQIIVKGRQSHGARPWQGIDPIVTSAEIISALQTVVSRQVDLTANPAVVTVGVIKGGSRFNIVPESAEMLGTLRTFDAQQRATIQEGMQRIVQNIAEANGATASLIFGADNNPVTFNNVALTKRVVPSLQRAAGAEHVKALPLETGAEDYAHFANKIPGFYFYVGITPPGKDPKTVPVNHSPLFFLDESALAVGVRALLYVATDYLQSGSEPRTSQSPD